MIKTLAVLLMGLLCIPAAGCVRSQPAPDVSTSPAATLAASPTVAPEVSYAPEATPDAGPEAAPADSEAVHFFYQAPASTPQEAAIHIYKGRRALELVLDGAVAGRFPIGLGFAPEGDKEKEGDGRTPIGEYYVCTRNDRSRFYLSLGVSYPNTEDARRGLQSGLIDQETYDRIADAQAQGRRPDWDTALGGEICIHSGGSGADWTWGCIATGNETMDILWEHCLIGTPILIYE